MTFLHTKKNMSYIMSYTKILTLLITLSICSIFVTNASVSAQDKTKSNQQIGKNADNADASDYLKLSHEMMNEGDLIADKIEDTDTKSADSDTLLTVSYNNMLEGDKIERYQKSITYANKALLIAQQKGNKSVEKKIYIQLSEIYEKLGNQEYADNYKRKSEEIADSISTSKASALGKVKPLWYKRYGWTIILMVVLLCAFVAITIVNRRKEKDDTNETVSHKKRHKHTKRTKEEKNKEVEITENQIVKEKFSHTTDNDAAEETEAQMTEEQNNTETNEQINSEEDEQKNIENNETKIIKVEKTEIIKAEETKNIAEETKPEVKKRTIIIKGKTNSFVELNPESIIFIKSDKNYITIYYLNNKRKIVSTELYQSLSRALDIISTEERFFRCHRSYAVNMRFVTSWNEASVKTTCTQPIPSSKIFVDKFEEENNDITDNK